MFDHDSGRNGIGKDHHKRSQITSLKLVGQRGFEPQSKRPKRSRIDQATLLSLPYSWAEYAPLFKSFLLPQAFCDCCCD